MRTLIMPLLSMLVTLIVFRLEQTVNWENTYRLKQTESKAATADSDKADEKSQTVERGFTYE